MSDSKLKYLFNPAQKEARQLKAEFVVRTAVFDQIFSEIQEDTMQNPPQHYMLLGQRGMGKTTLLLRLKYAVQDDESLQRWLLPVLFNEEQYAMSDLASFFEQIALHLAEDHPAYEGILDDMRTYELEADYDQRAFEVLVASLKRNGHKIIVFHDNFGQFLEKIGKIATHRLRNILMNSPHFRLVGASATLLEHTFAYKEPFFDFFYQIRLKGINTEETIRLFRTLAENEGRAEVFDELLKTERPRIEVMRKLSGGVIRTMVMLFEIFMDQEAQDSFRDLEAILDRVTPLYKHRMDDLKPQQQQIVDAVARAWDATTVSEIATLCRAERQGLKTNQISAQLKQLVENGIIEIEPRTQGRTHLYRLQERFFNIWYLMRYSTRQDKQRVIWFVKFLEGWCTSQDLKQLFERFDQNLDKGAYELTTVFDRALAYSMVENEDVLEEKVQLLENAIVYLEKKSFDKNGITFLKQEFYTILKKAWTNRFLAFIKENTAKMDVGRYIVFDRISSDLISAYKSEKNISIYDIIFVNVLIYALLNEFDKSDRGFHILSEELASVNNDLIQVYFEILLAYKQYHSAHRLFEKYQVLKDRLRPLYFLTMEYLKEEYPNEYLKAGEEYQETLEELKEQVHLLEALLGD